MNLCVHGAPPLCLSLIRMSTLETFACPHSGLSMRALRALDSRKLAALSQQLAAPPVPTWPVQLAPPGMSHTALHCSRVPGARGLALPFHPPSLLRHGNLPAHTRTVGHRLTGCKPKPFMVARTGLHEVLTLNSRYETLSRTPRYMSHLVRRRATSSPRC